MAENVPISSTSCVSVKGSSKKPNRAKINATYCNIIPLKVNENLLGFSLETINQPRNFSNISLFHNELPDNGTHKVYHTKPDNPTRKVDN